MNDEPQTDPSATEKARGKLAEQAEAAADHPETQKAKKSLTDLKDQVAGQAREHADAAKERLHGHAEERRNRVAENLRGVASGLKTAAGEIREKPETTAWQADGIARVASVAEQAADYLGERDTKELLTDARDYAKKYPLATIGGALVLGLVGARLLNASKERDHGSASGSAAAGASRFSGGVSGSSGGAAGGSVGAAGGSASHPAADHVHGTMTPAAPGPSVPADVPPPPTRRFEPSAPPPTGA
ncbi:hypothetical protein [Phycisphaera mikurensis]|nr:hypothetical protein [Phycisphaera mikurensis]MBB6440633.1 ElaB/YqjD/DUF883 family membrane-anchored ribosome-binding protein [Phycisphaera mikurensis]